MVTRKKGCSGVHILASTSLVQQCPAGVRDQTPLGALLLGPEIYNTCCLGLRGRSWSGPHRKAACANPSLSLSPLLLQVHLSALALGCEAGNGPHLDLDARVELLVAHVPDTLYRCGNRFVLQTDQRKGVRLLRLRARVMWPYQARAAGHLGLGPEG